MTPRRRWRRRVQVSWPELVSIEIPSWRELVMQHFQTVIPRLLGMWSCVCTAPFDKYTVRSRVCQPIHSRSKTVVWSFKARYVRGHGMQSRG
mmetsp:Transcript_831/g.2021  ORF Transcript_831/g.2021 Transcript_831/m.2021 type:complete len:92 (-) Transcript_831:155-430(-)